MKIIKNIAMLAVAAGGIATATPSLAVTTLTFASVTGPTGTVWDTPTGGFYSLFLANPFGSALNANDNFTGYAINAATGDFDLAGDGFPTATTNQNLPQAAFNSDPFYTISARLSNGLTTQTVTGTYTLATNTFVANNSATIDNVQYSISGFNWERSKRNIVGAYTVDGRNSLVGPGSRFDYQGTFGLQQLAVPEPAVWGLMIAGFGIVGFQSRRRRGIKTVTA